MALLAPIPLEPAWRDVLEVAASRRIDTRALGILVERLSRRYLGEPDVALARGDELLARTLFWFPRDVQKAALPIAELALAGALPPRPLRVLDIGAGLGAASFGLERVAMHPALRHVRFTVEHIEAVDSERDVLQGLERISREARRRGLLPSPGPELVTRTGNLHALEESKGQGVFDVVLVANALVEVTRDAGDESERGALLASHIERLVSHALAPDGALVVIEPATRPETRALHHARASLIERGFGIFAPCTHLDACPMLARERDWCHEDLASDLPEWLTTVARAAGLRWEGLTFSYLVVRRDRTHSVGALVARDGWVSARLVSTPRETKGKTEAFASGPFGLGRTGPRLMQLAREAKRREGPNEGVALADCARGDVVAVARDAITATEASSEASAARPIRVGPAALRRVVPDDQTT
jgi:SAM-dependent methyltransferase